jgi:hypothetical protein
MLKPTFVLAAILALVIPLSGQQDTQQDQGPRVEPIPTWHVHVPYSGKWIASFGIPRACVIFANSGNGRYQHIFGEAPWMSDVLKPKKGGFKISDIQELSEGGVIVKVMPRAYLGSDLEAEERQCLQENQPQPPRPQDK